VSPRPRLVVFSSLFPSPSQAGAGLFIRERMFRVGAQLPLFVVSPQPWFPGQGLARRLRPAYRPPAPRREVQQGVDVYRPRFFALPGLGRRWDGLSMAVGALALLRRLRGRFDVVDAHFAYPDGYAATLLGGWLDAPVTVTLRGTEARHARDAALRPRLVRALSRASRVFAVSDSLRCVALDLGMSPAKGLVVGNGVDSRRFSPMDRAEARGRLGLPPDAQVLITVGALVERKGYHRVMQTMPSLLPAVPGLHYLAVGGASPEGDWSAELAAMARDLGVAERVHFLGPMPPDDLRVPLSAADVFVLASRNEGWANVILEAMACGLPVVATDVGGNREVVCREDLGTVVPFDDAPALRSALAEALGRDWDRGAIRQYARENDWDGRVATLVAAFRDLAGDGVGAPSAPRAQDPLREA